MAVVIELADAVVAALNEHKFSLPFVARRHFRPRFQLAELKELQVSVVPGGLSLDAGSRSQNKCEYELDVAVQKRLSRDRPDEMDALMKLVEEIVDRFRLQRLAHLPEAVWLWAENDPIYALEHLDQLNQFTSVVTLGFRIFR